MLKDDIQSQNDVMFNDMNEHIIMTHVSVAGFHPVAVFLRQAIVTFNTGMKGFESLVDPYPGTAGPCLR